MGLLYADKDKRDNSDYPASHQDKKVIGKIKDETAGVPIVEFIGLRSKMYSYILDNGKNGKTTKEIKEGCHREVRTAPWLQVCSVGNKADKSENGEHS